MSATSTFACSAVPGDLNLFVVPHETMDWFESRLHKRFVPCPTDASELRHGTFPNDSGVQRCSSSWQHFPQMCSVAKFCNCVFSKRPRGAQFLAAECVCLFDDCHLFVACVCVVDSAFQSQILCLFPSVTIVGLICSCFVDACDASLSVDAVVFQFFTTIWWLFLKVL